MKPTIPYVKLKQVESQLAQKPTHTELLSKAYKKLNSKANMTIVCQGDSMTYGQDTVSVDKRPISSTPSDNGTAHTITMAGVTYPEALQTYLRDIYNNTTTVINKGYSGDWAEESYKHWNTNSNADLAFLMLGTNDANLGATWVPSNVKGNIDKYLADMRKIISRYISWGTAVILLTPPRKRDEEDPTTTTSWNIEPFRHALMILGDEFGCPVVDAETFMNGCDYTYYSDGVHFNSKGYQYFASRLVSVVIGYGVKNPVKIGSGDSLLVRQTRDNIVNNGCTLDSTATSSGPEEKRDGEGMVLTIGVGDELYYGFETTEDNLILMPVFSMNPTGTTAATFNLDFGLEQGSIPLLSAANKLYQTQPQGAKPLSTIAYSNNTYRSELYDGTININTTDRYLWITNKGWHNIKVHNASASGDIYFMGFVVMSIKDFIAQQNNYGTTALRPAKVTVGYSYFDTTLNKPIWYTGTGWVDSVGTTV